MVINLWRYRGYIWRNAWSDLRFRYAGSSLGLLWNVATPLMQIVIFSTVFSVLMENKLPPGSIVNRFNFTIYLCAGLLPWSAFAEGLSRGTNSLLANAGYLKKLKVPEQVFIAQDVATYILSGTISLLVFVTFCTIVGFPPQPAWIQLFPALILFVGFAFGLSLLLASLNVFFRDTAQILSIVLLLWMWMTPIVYPATVLDHGNIGFVKHLLPFNPAYWFVDMFHQIVMSGRWLSPAAFVVPLLLVGVANVSGYVVLRKLRPEIRDAL